MGNRDARLFLATLGAMLAAGGPLPPPPRSMTPDPNRLERRVRLELDLYHAEEALLGARTPGAERKARRKVEAIRTALGLVEVPR